MKINTFNNTLAYKNQAKTNQNLSFSAEEIYQRLRVVELTPDSIEESRGARMLSLDQSSPSDYATVMALSSDWREIHTPDIEGDFIGANSDKRFFALEVPEDKTLSQQIQAIASATDSIGSLHIENLQASPNSIYDSDNRRFKGAGSVLLGGIVNYAINNGKQEITLDSANKQSDLFYKQNNFPRDLSSSKPNRHRLCAENAEPFIRGIEQKYDFKYPI